MPINRAKDMPVHMQGRFVPQVLLLQRTLWARLIYSLTLLQSLANQMVSCFLRRVRPQISTRRMGIINGP